jgi:hypothetical protein
LPSDIGFVEEVAGSDNPALFLSAADGWEGFVARLARIE